MVKINKLIKPSAIFLIFIFSSIAASLAAAQSDSPSPTREELTQKYTEPFVPITTPTPQAQEGVAQSQTNGSSGTPTPEQQTSSAPTEIQGQQPLSPPTKQPPKPRLLWDKLKVPPMQRTPLTPGSEQQNAEQPASGSQQPQRYNIYQ
jgi:hypothetical protein